MARTTTTADRLNRAITWLQRSNEMADAAISRGDIDTAVELWGTMNAWEAVIASLLAGGGA